MVYLNALPFLSQFFTCNYVLFTTHSGVVNFPMENPERINSRRVVGLNIPSSSVPDARKRKETFGNLSNIISKLLQSFFGCQVKI